MCPYVNIDAEIERMLRYSETPRLKNGVAIDVERIVRETFDFDVAYIGGLTIRGRQLLGALVPDVKLLLVEAKDMPERQRFTVAHECGHLVLDYRNLGSPSLFDEHETALFGCTRDDIEQVSEPSPWQRRRETLANKFAAGLLMPASLCREIFRRGATIEGCARSLVVSRQACQIRFEQLGFGLSRDSAGA